MSNVWFLGWIFWPTEPDHLSHCLDREDLPTVVAKCPGERQGAGALAAVQDGTWPCNLFLWRQPNAQDAGPLLTGSRA